MLSVLAVDDEVPSLDELSYLLRTSELVGSVAVTQSATDALRQLRDDHFDVVLLDIRMPGLDGLDLARVLARFSEPPVVVFVTAHDEHALEAFDVGAAGYLLKPLNRERLERVLRRATGGHQAAEEPDAVPVESGGRTILVDRQDICWVESAGDYVRLHLRDGPSYLWRAAISVLEAQWRRLRPDPPQLPRRGARHPRAADGRLTDDGQGRRDGAAGQPPAPARAPGPARSPRPPGLAMSGREVVRAPARRSTVVGHSPAAGDLYEQDNYARTLLSSLMRAQLGATVTVLVPAAALLLLYPAPGRARAEPRAGPRGRGTAHVHRPRRRDLPAARPPRLLVPAAGRPTSSNGSSSCSRTAP